MKGNRQGSLSRSITRRSDQNRKIKYCFYFAILPQLVKKVRSDLFDKLTRHIVPRFYSLFSMVPPPSTTSPSYSTTACPGVMARWGWSNTTRSPPSGRG